MGRMPRIIVPGLPHHVTQRGNGGADIFSCDGDCKVYIAMFEKAVARYGLGIWAYCLMSNHVHFIAVPSSESSLSLALKDASTAYANWFNRKRERSGHLWQGRFYSCVMDEPHLWAAVRYVERNPVAAGMCQRAEEHPWSSAAAHCAQGRGRLLSDGFPPAGVVADWKKWLADEDVAMSKEIRTCTRYGRPCGTETFLSTLEGILGRPLRPGRPGRKMKPQVVVSRARI